MDARTRYENTSLEAGSLPGAPLTDLALETYVDQGFLILRNVFAPSDIDAMSIACERLTETARGFDTPTVHQGTQFVTHRDRATGTHRIDRVVWVGGSEPTLAEYGADPRLLALAGQILRRPEVEQLINQVHFKYPGDGVKFEWHQDSRHRRQGTDLWTDLDGRGSFLETITAVDSMGMDNGPLLVIPRSNHLGHVPVNMPSKELPSDTFDPADAVPILMNPGDVLLMSPFVIHSSQPNTGQRSRRIFLNGYCIPGANRRVYPGCDAGRTLSVPAGSWDRSKA